MDKENMLKPIIKLKIDYVNKTVNMEIDDLILKLIKKLALVNNVDEKVIMNAFFSSGINEFMRRVGYKVD